MGSPSRSCFAAAHAIGPYTRSRKRPPHRPHSTRPARRRRGRLRELDAKRRRRHQHLGDRAVFDERAHLLAQVGVGADARHGEHAHARRRVARQKRCRRAGAGGHDDGQKTPTATAPRRATRQSRGRAPPRRPRRAGSRRPCGKPSPPRSASHACVYASAERCSAWSMPMASARRKMPVGVARSHFGTGRVWYRKETPPMRRQRGDRDHRVRLRATVRTKVDEAATGEELASFAPCCQRPQGSARARGRARR